MVLDIEGLEIACVAWGDASSATKILCVHGYLDNLNTWRGIQPKLAAAGAYVVAVDLPGHGRSGRFAKLHQYHFIDHGGI